MKTLIMLVTVAMLASSGSVFDSISGKLGEIFKKETPAEEEIIKAIENNTPAAEPETAPGKPELLAMAETREEAETIATLYSITLAEYYESTMLATFWNTSGSTGTELVTKGLENGWPPIEINHVAELY